VPKTRGTRAAVARAALKAGYSHKEVQAVLKPLASPVPIADFIRENSPRVPEQDAERLSGRPERPMPRCSLTTRMCMSRGRSRRTFELSVDESVDVEVRASS
jgi:hypothetical protein